MVLLVLSLAMVLSMRGKFSYPPARSSRAFEDGQRTRSNEVPGRREGGALRGPKAIPGPPLAAAATPSRLPVTVRGVASELERLSERVTGYTRGAMARRKGQDSPTALGDLLKNTAGGKAAAG